jgi:hypothetical protein
MLFGDRAREVWKALELDEYIQQTTMENQSGSVVLEHLLRSKLPALGSLRGLPMKEVIAVASWFIWWRRREIKNKGSAPSQPD